MTYKIIKDGIHKGTVVIENGITIGDIVSIRNYGGVYSTYSQAFEYFWGGKYDGFHNHRGQLYQAYLSGLYENLWKVMNIAVHKFGDSLIVHVKDMYGRNLVVGIDCLRIKRKSKTRKEVIEVEKLV